MIEAPLTRRHILGATALFVPVALLGGCATPLGSYGVDEGVRRLLTLSSQRAFERLIRPGGFYDDQLTRLTLPETGGQNDVLAAVLRTNAVRGRIAMALNDIAVDAADRATPVVLDSIRGLTFGDALAVLRGGPTAATDLLARSARGAVIDAMFPEFSNGLRSDATEIVSAIVSARTGIDYGAIARSAADQAGNAIFRAIGREEAAIRADPRRTGDPVLTALLLGSGR
ncbi:MAG: DUF4197 domain-containing protein [Sphingomonas hengshuiensis]|uniref:DUF4197 domain-containing protein n=1 Tax=Sphingomonas hengshuiensis TaxID=1609977 RepID=A0A2W5B6M5_9SPHN|nr:MAG: DUF4197 domain-containing protein [Sphingomonas hengshuiensis]